jgi:hypothetical protein
LRRLAEEVDPAAEPVLGLLTLARALQAAGDDGRAELLLRRGVHARPQEVVLVNALGQLLAGQRRWPEAVDRRLHAAAAWFYAGAFAADPKLTTDLRRQHRYNAACSAALAAAGQGEDARNLPDKARLMLRRQALGWLCADLALYVQLAQRDEPAAKQAVRQALTRWQQDADLAAVRDKAALDLLPDDERQPWRRLWDDVAALLAGVGPASR